MFESRSRSHRQTSAVRLGHLAPWKHAAVYVSLLILVGADFLLLHQALVMLNRAQSAVGAIGPELYFVTLGFSTMMIVLPHVAAIIARRVADGIYRRSWIRFVVAIGVIWLAILVLVTAMRIVAYVPTPSAAELAAGVDVTKSGVDLLSPNSFMAYMTAFFLTSTGLVSLFVTWFTSRPLLVAVERAERAEVQAFRDLDAGAVALHEAELDLESAKALDGIDARRHELAKQAVDERLSRLRADVFAAIAEHERDPRVTSHLMRELHSRRDHLTVVGRTGTEDAR